MTAARAAKVNKILADLAQCLCSKIEENGLVPPCYCGVMPGDAVAIDYVGQCDGRRDGMAWVRLAMLYPAGRVGVPDSTLRNCGKGLGIDIEIGIIRTAPMWGDDGEPPEEAANLAGSEQLVNDAMAIHEAIACCPTLSHLDYIVQTYRPTILGMALGGSFTVLTAI